MIARTLVVTLVCFFATASTARAEDTAKLDLKRYLGTWYELARFDHRFERGCVGVTATYSKNGDDLKVKNRCVKGDLGGEVKDVEGKAWVPDPAEPGKLKVQFFWPFRADYWVLEVAPDYSWALVGNPDKDNVWILSREPQVSEELYDSLVAKLKARGYDTTKLLRVKQAEKQ